MMIAHLSFMGPPLRGIRAWKCVSTAADVAFAEIRAVSQSSRNPFHAGHAFRGFLVHRAMACQLLAPRYGSDWNA